MDKIEKIAMAKLAEVQFEAFTDELVKIACTGGGADILEGVLPMLTEEHVEMLKAAGLGAQLGSMLGKAKGAIQKFTPGGKIQAMEQAGKQLDASRVQDFAKAMAPAQRAGAADQSAARLLKGTALKAPAPAAKAVDPRIARATAVAPPPTQQQMSSMFGGAAGPRGAANFRRSPSPAAPAPASVASNVTPMRQRPGIFSVPVGPSPFAPPALRSAA